MSPRIFKKAFLILATLFSAQSFAQTELPQPGGFASLLLGYSKPHSYEGRLGYGAEIGLQMVNQTSVFGYFLASEKTESNVKLEAKHYGVGADYAFLQMAGIRLGARVGGADITGRSTGISVGPHLIWDYKIAPQLSVGVEPIILFDTGNDSGTTSYLFATGKFWF